MFDTSLDNTYFCRTKKYFCKKSGITKNMKIYRLSIDFLQREIKIYRFFIDSFPLTKNL